MREYFHAYHSILESIEPLDDAERGRLFTALLSYSATGETPLLTGNERFLFPALREQILLAVKLDPPRPKIAVCANATLVES